MFFICIVQQKWSMVKLWTWKKILPTYLQVTCGDQQPSNFAVTTCTRVRGHLCEHAVTKPHWDCEKNRASTAQVSMSWYMSEREWGPAQAQSFNSTFPPCFKPFHLPLLGTARSNFGFLWDSSIEVHLVAYSEGTGKNDKGSLEVPKKKQFLPTSREWHHISTDCA